MKHSFLAAATLLCGLATAALAPATHATTLTFDDIGKPGKVTSTGFVEQGFQFSNNTDVVDISTGSPWAWAGAAHSGKYAALNDYGGNVTMTKSGGGTFSVSDYFLTQWSADDKGTVTTTGYKGNTVVGSVTTRLTSSWTDVMLGFSGIDRLVISLTDCTYLLIDDVTVNKVPDTNVPEPASLALLGAGMLGMAGLRRQARQAN